MLLHIQINKIYCEDCITFMRQLPDGYVDLIIADPPYNIGQDGGDGWDRIDNYLGVFDTWACEWNRVLKENGMLYCYCGQKYSADIELIFRKYFYVQNKIIWHYNNGQRSATRKFSCSYEPIFLLSKNKKSAFKPVRDSNNIQKGIRTKKHKNGKISITYPHPEGVKLTDVWKIPKLSGNRKQTKHPTEKPLELSEIMLKSIDAELIYIPFAGSGSEIVTCVRNNVNYIATEMSQKYIKDIIIPRLEKMTQTLMA